MLIQRSFSVAVRTDEEKNFYRLAKKTKKSHLQHLDSIKKKNFNISISG